MEVWNIVSRSDLAILPNGCVTDDVSGGLVALGAFVVGFLVAQICKMLIGVLERRNTGVVDFKTAVGYMSKSGGMPSGHTASFVALVTVLGLFYGFNSGVFALGVATALIIMYDAIHVRYAVGEQGKVLNVMLKKNGKAELPVVEGHTLSEVIAGMVIGVMVGGGMCLIFG